MPVDRPRIILTGASGLIGLSVRRSLEARQTEILQLVRDSAAIDERRLLWDPYATVPIADPARSACLEGSAGAIHLSGASVAGRRWTARNKQTIVASRVQTTHALASLLGGLRAKPPVLVCASAVGIYGDRGDEVLDEASAPGSSFLAQVCKAWEEAAEPAALAGIRIVHLRFGVVLSPQGGALAQMLPIFRLGLGGKLGSGQQWMSWIALPDAVRAIEFALAAESLSGAINVVAPSAVTNLEFTRTLGHALARPTLLTAPAFALKLVLGEMADGAVLASQRVIPQRLQAAGFEFQHPKLCGALGALIS